ncbi:hypothetical protein B0H16DRAFT_1694971 [Mycena metata]|uniref:Uncharacterized protein n=1 Tax=Mycena metata TaxID=1033252 RepID=A0AAD7I9C4_9AGAR|nr:hypothetical protein B0H16DRAFT_1694971 [Mycena metata]
MIDSSLISGVEFVKAQSEKRSCRETVSISYGEARRASGGKGVNEPSGVPLSNKFQVNPGLVLVAIIRLGPVGAHEDFVPVIFRPEHRADDDQHLRTDISAPYRGSHAHLPGGIAQGRCARRGRSDEDVGGWSSDRKRRRGQSPRDIRHFVTSLTIAEVPGFTGTSSLSLSSVKARHLNNHMTAANIFAFVHWAISRPEGLFSAASMNELMQYFIQTASFNCLVTFIFETAVYLVFRDHLVLNQRISTLRTIWATDGGTTSKLIEKVKKEITGRPLSPRWIITTIGLIAISPVGINVKEKWQWVEMPPPNTRWE